jgi:hypothetical protein
MMFSVLPFLPFSQNQPLKLADDWYMRILKNKIKDVLDEIKGTKKVNPLKSKRNLLYIKTQSVPHCKHFSSRL